MQGQTILITGGTGSLGQEIVRQAIHRKPKTIRVLSRNEYFQWEMQKSFNNSIIRFFIGDVRDKDRLWRAMDGVDIVIHAAALKHISICEYNPIEAVKTNIEGSINVIETILDRHVDKVLAVSTDKAVNPVNIYGATKLCMEKLFIDANVYGGKFSCVRCGNFFGSRGSVMPLFEEQALTGKITITDPSMQRYFIDISDAAKFILDCADTMQGSEIFVPDMRLEGIRDIVSKTFPDTEIEYIGKQKGEKLLEEIMTEDEKAQAVKIEGGYLIKC